MLPSSGYSSNRLNLVRNTNGCCCSSSRESTTTYLSLGGTISLNDPTSQQQLDMLTGMQDTLSMYMDQFFAIQGKLDRLLKSTPADNQPLFKTEKEAHATLGVEIKPQYAKYIKKYGIPANGVWNPQYLLEFQ